MSRQPEEDIEDLRKKFHVQAADTKLIFQSTQMDHKKNKEQIQKLQKENKELREQLQSKVFFINLILFYQKKVMSMTETGSDFGMKTEKDLAVWRRRMDEVRNKSLQKKDHLL